MDTLDWLRFEADKSLTNLKSCCSSFVGMLPEPALPFLPAFILGTLVSSAILVYLVHKDTKKSYVESVYIFLKQLFSSYERDDQNERQKSLCCLLDRVCMRLNNKAIKCSDRIKCSVQHFLENSREMDNSINENACLKIDLLTAHSFWNQFNAFDREKKILMKNFPKIKEEFMKVFSEFQRGICKQWVKVEVLNGHSCCYDLIKKGVINTTNCQACPATFQVLSECRVMGLSGCMFGSASFTLLYPDSKVGPSFGLTNAIIKCDFVLQSTTSGVLEVSGEQRQWKEQEMYFYDSSQPHTTSLASSKDMTVLATPLALLSFDLWHPDLETAEREALSLLFAS